MEIKNAKFTMLIDEDEVEIEIEDRDASITFVRVKLDPKQLCKALSGVRSVDCDAEVFGLNLIGKKYMSKRLEFKMPDGSNWHDTQVAWVEAQRICPNGWKPENYFNSQDSFFLKDDEYWAKCVIRRWE